MVKYCDGCLWLAPTEENQTPKKEHHICGFYNRIVYHKQFHPKIVRLSYCTGYTIKLETIYENILEKGLEREKEQMNHNKWGAILWKKWEKGAILQEIIGYWAEDNNEYKITVPYQLRDMIIEMQNWLSDKYQKIQVAKKAIVDLEGFFK